MLENYSRCFEKSISFVYMKDECNVRLGLILGDDRSLADSFAEVMKVDDIQVHQLAKAHQTMPTSGHNSDKQETIMRADGIEPLIPMRS